MLMKFCQICKSNDHNTDHCPSKVISGSCPSREIVPVHVVQVEVPVVQEEKQLQNYNVPNNQNQYIMINNIMQDQMDKIGIIIIQIE